MRKGCIHSLRCCSIIHAVNVLYVTDTVSAAGQGEDTLGSLRAWHVRARWRIATHTYHQD